MGTKNHCNFHSKASNLDKFHTVHNIVNDTKIIQSKPITRHYNLETENSNSKSINTAHQRCKSLSNLKLNLVYNNGQVKESRNMSKMSSKKFINKKVVNYLKL